MATNPQTTLGALLAHHWQRARDQAIASGEEPPNVKDIAAATWATRQSVYYWLSGERRPSASSLEAMANLFEADESSRRELYSQLLAALEASGKPKPLPRGSRQLAIMSGPRVLLSADIAVREKYASDLWIFKWGKPFLSGDDSTLFSELRRAIQGQKGVVFPRFHYVYPSEAVIREVQDLPTDYHYPKSRISDSRALYSFVNLERALRKEFGDSLPEGYAETIFKHELSSLADVLFIGIPRVAIGLFMIEYNPQGRDVYGRNVDIFVEVDSLVASFMQSPDQSEMQESPQTFWIALPKSASKEIYDMWSPLLHEIETEVDGQIERAA